MKAEGKQNIDGISCYTVGGFAEATGKTPHTIYQMISGKSAGLRPLRVLRVGTQYFIPETELVEYPFVKSGRYGASRPYHFTAPGVKKDYPIEDLIAELSAAGIRHPGLAQYPEPCSENSDAVGSN